jgi:hypothetical protein
MSRHDRRSRSRVREPVQAYLDEADHALLEEVVRRTGLARAEILRRGLRAFARDALAERKPGWSLEFLIGSIPDGPSDLSERHDEYLAQTLEEQHRRSR